jgi:hypothetical protein
VVTFFSTSAFALILTSPKLYADAFYLYTQVIVSYRHSSLEYREETRSTSLAAYETSVLKTAMDSMIHIVAIFCLNLTSLALYRSMVLSDFSFTLPVNPFTGNQVLCLLS